jgi:phosphate transport system permease protein
VLPAALPGIVSGAMLAVARAAGETAPLLFTIGISRKFTPSLSAQNTALPSVIWTNAQQPFPAAVDRAWGAALTLITIVFVLTLIARIVAARFATKTS